MDNNEKKTVAKATIHNKLLELGASLDSAHHINGEFVDWRIDFERAYGGSYFREDSSKLYVVVQHHWSSNARPKMFKEKKGVLDIAAIAAYLIDQAKQLVAARLRIEESQRLHSLAKDEFQAILFRQRIGAFGPLSCTNGKFEIQLKYLTAQQAEKAIAALIAAGIVQQTEIKNEDNVSA